jgi:hypothetical protein
MKKTALDWFITEFKKEVWFEPDSELDIWIKELIPKAKEMEKEQMLNAFQESRLTHPMIGFKHETFVEYYNQFKQQNQ